jgi:uncharacterized protein (DUF433 family)/DNA-binding transcriptional MerR regulator
MMAGMAELGVTPASLTPEETRALRQALRYPRGRYEAVRAAQLSGVPARTVYHWASSGVLVPDYYSEKPHAWSYRDLVYLRLAAWLRSHNVELDDVTQLVNRWRDYFAMAPENVQTEIHTDGRGLSLGPMYEDILTHQRPFETMVEHTVAFDVLEPVDREFVGRSRLWGPNLIRPSELTAISPWVMNGEPCLRHTRIPTSNLYVLHRERGLAATDLAELYPGTDVQAIADGLALEERLQEAA